MMVRRDSSDKYLLKRRKATAKPPSQIKESAPDWRTELSEVIGDTDVKKVQQR